MLASVALLLIAMHCSRMSLTTHPPSALFHLLFNMSSCAANCGQATKSHLLFYTCRCTQQRYVCEECVQGLVRCLNGVQCPLCRTDISTLAKVISVPELVAKSQKQRGVNAGIEEDDFRYRWEVSSILGVRATSVVDAEYLVKWKQTSAVRRAAAPTSTWESAANLSNGGEMVEKFHRRHGLVALSDPAFQFPITLQFADFQESKVRGKLEFKCGHSGCDYVTPKRSNMRSMRGSTFCRAPMSFASLVRCVLQPLG